MAETIDKLIYVIELHDKASAGLKNINSALKSVEKEMTKFAQFFQQLDKIDYRNIEGLSKAMSMMTASIVKFGQSLAPIQAMVSFFKDTEKAIRSLVASFITLSTVDMKGFSDFLKTFDPFLAKIKEAGPALSALGLGLAKMVNEAQKATAENERLKQKLDEAKKATDQANASFTAQATVIEQTTRTWKTWQETLKSAFISILKGLDSMVLGIENFVKNGANIDKLVISGFKNLIGIIGEAGKALLDFGLNIAKKAFEGLIALVSKATGAIVDFAKYSVKAYADFEEALGGARRTMDLNDESIKVLIKDLQDLSMNFEEGGLKAGVTTDALAEIAGIAGQMDISITKDQVAFDKFVETVAKTSVAFEMSADSAASALGIISNIFKLPIENADQLGGAIATIGNKSQATVPQLLDFVQRIGGVGANFGLTAEQAIAMGGAVREGGLSIETAGTAVSNIFTKMQTDMSKFKETLAAGGLDQPMFDMAVRSKDAGLALKLVLESLINLDKIDSVKASEAMKDLGISGARGVSVLQTLIAQYPKYQGFLEAIQDPTKNVTALNNAYESSLQGLNKQWDATKNIVTVIAQLLGEKLSIAFATVLKENINPFLLKLQEWIATSPAIKAILGELSAGIKWLGQEVVTLGTRFIEWVSSSDTALNGSNIGNWLKDVGQQVKDLWNAVKSFDWGGLWRDVSGIVKDIANALQNNEPIISRLNAGLQDFLNFCEDIKAAIDGFGQFFTDLGTRIDQFSGMLDNVQQKISNVVQDLTGMKGGGEAVFSGMGKAATEAAKVIGDTLTAGGLTPLLNRLTDVEEKSHGNSVFPDMADWAGVAAGAIDTTTGAAKGLSDSLGYINPVLDNMMSQLSTFKPVEIALPQVDNSLTAKLAAAKMNDPIAMQNPQLWAEIQNRQNDPQYLAAVQNARDNFYRMNGQIDPRRQIQAVTQPAQGQTTAGIWGDRQASNSNKWAITINAGANLVDEYSLGQFATTIEKKIQEKRGW